MNCSLLIGVKRIVLWMVLLLCGMSVSGQSDSIEADNVPVFIQKVADIADWGVELVTFEKENYTFFILPLMGYEDRTKLSVGVMPVWRFYLGQQKDTDNYFRPSSIAPSVIYSTSGMYELDFTSDFYTGNKWYVRNKWLYQWMPDKYYHIGNTTEKDAFSDIEVKKLEFKGKVMKGVSKEVFVGVNYDIGIYNIKHVGIGILNEDVLGFDGGDVVGVGPIVSYDSRNSIVYPDKGDFVSLEYLYYPELFGDYSFSSLTFDARKYFKLGANEKVLATQFYLKSASGDVPFYRLPALGGKRLFRGIARPYKYMDKNSMYLQAAYRSRLWWRLGYELFTGVGNVYENWDSSIIDNLHLMGGAGLRVRVLQKEKLSFRFDYGISTNGNTGFFFTLGEAF